MESNESQQVNPNALKEKEIAEAAAVFEKHGFEIPLAKKVTKRKEKQSQKDARSIVSLSQISETESKKSEGTKSLYSIGDKIKSGAIVRKVIENDWIDTKRRDKKYNKIMKCKNCSSECRADHRNTHKCGK